MYKRQVYTDLLVPGGFSYVSKFTDQHSKWKEVLLINENADAVHTLKQFVQTVVIPRGGASRISALTGEVNTRQGFSRSTV